MTVLEEVKRMQQQGMQEPQIVQSLQQRGIPNQSISEAMAQSKIRAAVEAPGSENSQEYNQIQAPTPGEDQNTNSQFIDNNAPIADQNTGNQYSQASNDYPQNSQIQGMQPSIMQQPEQNQQEQNMQEYEPQYQGYETTGYSPYEYQSPGLSSDTISEIAEQIVSEKMSELRKKMEKAIDFRTEIEAKTDSIGERLKRIEKIIDTLNTSVLRKVGDYVTNIDDIKKELIETQKSFSKAIPSLKKHSHKKTTKKHSKK